MDFDKIILKPMSWLVLSNLYCREPRKSEEIATELNLNKRQVDAVVTKTLVRYGFCIREAKLTRLMKKEYNLIKITDRGNSYVKWRNEKSISSNDGK